MVNLLRFIVALIIAPIVTSLLILPPINYNEWYDAFMKIVLIYTYGVSLVIGLPIALILVAIKKCTLKILSLTGFILGFSSCIIFLDYQLHDTYKLVDIASSLKAPIWYGISAAIGASIFGLVSGIKMYNETRGLVN